MKDSKQSWFSIVAPGILLAATGVGAGDLLTSTLAGSEVGLTVLWASIVGAFLKYYLTEGIARWQLATDTTILEGWSWKLGGWIRWGFMIYLVFFSVVVGAALVSACGVAGAGLLPIGDLEESRLVWGIIHSCVGFGVAWLGSFAAFEKIMAALTGTMFVTVIFTAVAVAPDLSAIAMGLIPQIPAEGTSWVIAVLGGVGGTVTLLSYGYWIQERGRRGAAMLPICRLDLAVGNGITALFGVAVIIIGARVELEGQGSALALQLAAQLEAVIGPAGKWIFLMGFWAAVFSSLLGVWQSIPYLFADFLDLQTHKQGVRRARDLRKTKAYRGGLAFIAVAPLAFLSWPVRQIQLTYGMFAAFFLPLLALTLLIMNNKRRWVGSDFLSSKFTNVVLGAALVLFAYLSLP